MKRIDTIIVGQGLAGSLLAWECVKHGQTILIIDNDNLHAASVAAAGIINPVTGKRFVLDSASREYLGSALRQYQALEQFFQESFYHPTPTMRVFNSSSDLQQFKKRTQNDRYLEYLGKQFPNTESQILKQNLGGFYQTKTGYLHIQLLLKCLKNHFTQHHFLMSGRFDYSAVKPTANAIIYQHDQTYHADRLIFCEGFQIKNNPWFSYLPLIPTKGEILSLTSNTLVSSHIINNGNWLLPTVDGSFKYGATYEPNCSDTNIKSENRQILLKNFNNLFKPHVDLNITKQQAGIRPCTIDREPLIGMHPSESRLGVFNGFGSKGAMTIPYFAQQLFQSMCGKAELAKFGNISRFNPRQIRP